MYLQGTCVSYKVNMKRYFVRPLLIILCLLVVFTGCSDTQPQPEPHQPDAETAMDNFVRKLQAGNYVVDVEDYLRTTVVSPDQVYYVHNVSSYQDDFGFVTVNGETFHGILEEDSFTEIGFEGPDNAITVAARTLPNYWIELCNGNMWELFYNNVDNPLEFISNDDNVKITLLGLRGDSEMALQVMEEVHVLLDAEDPTTVRFTAELGSSGMISFDDLDLTLQFGTAASDPRIEKWAAKPTYPEVRSGWTFNDVVILDKLFHRDYGIVAVPFPSFASYALIFDKNVDQGNTEILIRDAHASENDVEDYKKTLLANGYEAVTSDDSSTTVYRKLLRDQYNAYAELYPYYDKGLALYGRMYYVIDQYEDRSQLNEFITQYGFTAFPDTDIFSSWATENRAKIRSEGWQYYFDYDVYMYLNLPYQDEDAARAYFENYGKLMAQDGFIDNYSPNLDGNDYQDSSGIREVKYDFRDDGIVRVELTKEKSMTPDDAKALIVAHGMPEIDLHGDIKVKDVSRYYYETATFQGLHLNVYQPFESMQAAESFLDEYVSRIEELGYERTSPQEGGSVRSNLYLNQALLKRVGFDIYQSGDGALVFFEFISTERQQSSLLETLLHR